MQETAMQTIGGHMPLLADIELVTVLIVVAIIALAVWVVKAL